MQSLRLLVPDENRRVVVQADSKALKNECDFSERLCTLAGMLAGLPHVRRH